MNLNQSTSAARGGSGLSARSMLGVAVYGLPLLFIVVTFVPYMATTYVGERDVERMVFGIVFGTVSGLRLASDEHYGLQFSFGAYELLYRLLPHETLRNPRDLALAIVSIGWVSSIASVWLCFAWLRRVADERVAWVTTSLFAFSPIVLFSATVGHPLLPSFALALAGACCLEKSDRTAQLSLSWAFLAWLFLTLSLSVRAETAFLFPAMVLPLRQNRLPASGTISVMLWRAVPLTLAFGAFLLLKGYYEHRAGSSWALSEFLSQFYRPEKSVRGAAVMVMAAGFGLVASAALALLWRPRRTFGSATLLFAAALALPTIVFWLPNPQPARHFYFAVLGLAFIVGHFISRHAVRNWWLIGCTIAILLLNQVLVELAYPRVVASYTWSYPSQGERRATTQVPIGAVFPDLRARNLMQSNWVAEAELLASSVGGTPRLLLFADVQSTISAYLVRQYPDLRPLRYTRNGVAVLRLKSADREYVLVSKYQVRPRDVQAEFLVDQEFDGWPVYIQSSTLSPFDVTAIPSSRAFLPDPR